MLAQGCGFLLSLMVVSYAALAGTLLAPVAGLATLPAASFATGVAIAAWPVARARSVLPQRWLFSLSAVVGVFGSALSVAAIHAGLFYTLCLGCLFMGSYFASVQLYRYAAAEAVAPEHAARAIALILLASWS